MPASRVRRSFRDLEEEHYLTIQDKGPGPTQLDKVVKAFHHICVTLPPEDPNSFFIIGGYHGEPFRGAGWGNGMWWGGYCYHGQILFPTWHRAYCQRLEDALRTAPGCADVTLPFLDWCEDRTLKSGLPDTLTDKSFTYSDGTVLEENPLYSYKFQKSIFDNVPANLAAEVYDYTKLKGYNTVRYPYSGLVGGSDDQRRVTTEWNEQAIFKNGGDKKLLNDNVVNWLSNGEALDPQKPKPAPGYQGVYDKFRNCLAAPNFTVFSNTTSAQQYNQDKLNMEFPKPPDPNELTTPLESPHNAMHLATGGFTAPITKTAETVTGANGDMGENNTAGLDPIFFLHHCYIDRMFWLWQQRHGQTQKIVIDPGWETYPGTNNMDSQGPVAGAAAGEQLTLDTPLTPFKKSKTEYYTSKDVVDIEELGYTYGPGSFDLYIAPEEHIQLGAAAAEGPPSTHIAISGINRAKIRGSFTVLTYHKGQLVAAEPVLSRNNVQGCANCQSHLDVRTFAPLHGVTADSFDEGDVRVDVDSHRGRHEFDKSDSKSFRIKPIFHK